MEAFYASNSPRLSGAVDLDDEKPVARGIWSELEHERFLEAMKAYPLGPWRTIADHVGTRSIKQVQTHAQKYQQKVARRQRGLRKQKKRVARPEHRVDQAAAGFIVRMPVTGAAAPMPMLKTEPDASASPMSPSSPSSFEELLRDATTAPPTPMTSSSSDEEAEIDLDELLRAIEPLPFSLDRACDPFASHQLHESLQLFLTSV